MAIPEGMFRLYSRIEPPLTAGDYRFTSTAELTATRPGETLDPEDLPVDGLTTHVRVRAPQYQLPADQVLSAFPPAGSEGAYGSRLPQIVIKRRTLPWERSVWPPGAGHEEEPWLALVLIAEGEAELRLNEPVADCVTHGIELDEPADVELGNCLVIRKSVVDRIFPTQEEVKLLAHAREVDLSDTELMMGDDDGYLSVVISNRLPLPGKDSEGSEVPVKYLACLINLSEQFDSLLDKAPEPITFTLAPLVYTVAQSATLADIDHATMGSATYTAAGAAGATAQIQRTVLNPHGAGGAAGAPQPKAVQFERTNTSHINLAEGLNAPYEAAPGWTQQVAEAGVDAVYTAMAQPFNNAVVGGFIAGELFPGGFINVDPTLKFPVLMHWGFTSTGQMTFRRLMEELDSGLLGTPPEADSESHTIGRLPFEAVETGHIGMAHRTRRGDGVRSWYRGPLVPHPTADTPAGRLPLAHAADQVRIVVPDGREDISLASAFEIGRLLSLSRPSMISALLRWRQAGFQVAQRNAVLAAEGRIFAELDFLHLEPGRDLGGLLGSVLAGAIATAPEKFLGTPQPLVRPGRLIGDRSGTGVNTLVAEGLGLSPKLLAGGAESVLGALGGAAPRVPKVNREISVDDLTAVLAPVLTQRFERTAADALIDDVQLDAAIKTALRRRNAEGPS